MSWLETELREQPAALERLLELQRDQAREIAGIFGRDDVQYVLIASRGSSGNAARYAQYVLGRAHRVPVMFATPSLYTIYEQPPRLDGAVVVGISQSGASPDVASVLAEARRQGRPTVALTRPDIYLQMIVDGHHLADETVRLIWAAAAGRVALVTDATAGANENPGSYQLGDIEIESSGGVVIREDGVFAGTVLTMIDAVRNLHSLGISFEDAVGAATSVPARILGCSDLGVLEPGGAADIVVLDERLEIVRVLCGGEARVVA